MSCMNIHQFIKLPKSLAHDRIFLKSAEINRFSYTQRTFHASLDSVTRIFTEPLGRVDDPTTLQTPGMTVLQSKSDVPLP